VQVDAFRILLALETSWTISINGKEFVHVLSSTIALNDSTLKFDRFVRKIVQIDAMNAGTVRVRARARLRRQTDVLAFFPGEKLPSTAELRRRRTTFQRSLLPALSQHFGSRVTRQVLYSDKRHGVGGAYPRFLVGTSQAVIAVDPDESSPVVNGIMRAAIQWATAVKRRIAVVVPAERSQTIATRLDALPALHHAFEWLVWDGTELSDLKPLANGVESHVHPYTRPALDDKVQQICALLPGLLQPVPHIAGNAVSLRFRGLEVVRVSESETAYPLGQPLQALVERLAQERRFGSRHPLAHAHEEAWLESNLVSQLREVLPVRQDHVYPQVPSFGGDERKIIDLLTITDSGRLVVIEIKAAADPDLPLQALDYWLAVERHRKAGDFTTNGYFGGIEIRDEPSLLVLVAPLLLFHRTLDRLTAMLPKTVPLLQIGINQTWKRKIKILRRKGPLS
jgi:hypothetical protein